LKPSCFRSAHMGNGAHPNPKSVGFKEFVALAAALMATQAISVDAMLPALPVISAAFGLSDQNRAQLIVTAYIVGVGLGQLFWGLLSDRFGRRPILLVGLTLYVIAAILSGLSSSFTTLLAWRAIHGVAAASVVIARSAVRDRYSGRQMARVISLQFIVFLMIPVIAPTLGQLVLWVAPWRSIFLLFGAYASGVFFWVLLRLPETLHPEYRLLFTRERIVHAVKLVLGDRTSVCYTMALAIMFGSILAYVGMVQQIFQDSFHRPSLMPTTFAICAGSMGITSYVNSRIVERVGMRTISQVGILLFIGVTALHTIVAALSLETIWSFVVLQSVTLACIGLTASNFGAMAMEPVGSVAGVGASLQGCISSTAGALVGALVGKFFNGSTLPLALGALSCGVVSLGFVCFAERGRLFNPHHAMSVGAESPG
jgi:DHA1 family bicyclomycin/chloramphenicol resistance-like MFS transporter